MTYPEEVEKNLGTPIEVEHLNKTKLKEVGLNCNHNTPLSSREVPSFDGPEPQPLLNSPSLNVSLGDVIGPEPPIKAHSPDSSRMKDISSIIDPRLLQVVLGKPFVEISNMTHDPPEGVVRFTNGNNEVAYKMPHKIEQYDSLSNLEKEHIKSVYLRNEEDKRRGVEYVMSKILGFFKECLELEPEYLTRMDDEGEVTGNNQENPNYQAPIQQTQVAPSNELSNYKKIIDANMKAMQNQINNVKNELRNEMQTSIQTSISNQTNELENMMASFFQMNTASSSGLGSLPSNTVANPRGDLKAITTRSGISYDGPPIPPLSKVVEREPKVTKDTVQPSTKNIQPLVVQIQAPIDEPVVTPKPKPSIPYPSRANKQKLREKDDNLASKFVKIFRELHFELSFADALLHMPKFASMFKSLLNNKENFECLALADLGASINLMPLSYGRQLSSTELYSYSKDSGNSCITIRLSGSGTTRALCLMFTVKNYPLELIMMPRTFKVGQTSRYSYNDDVSNNRIDVINIACEEYAQEVLEFSDSSTSGNPTPSLDPILSTSSLSLTPFEEGDFILEEIEKLVLQMIQFHQER
ncbi:hypothetical protein Tco_0977703 [Tanacetum coccineum]|uniref:Reverse transcriptase domain-containing protein n=1 Tax=Tanacetum coccineum TaxID=301880 RepID=A0ABQ5EKT9_9ASTR